LEELRSSKIYLASEWGNRFGDLANLECGGLTPLCGSAWTLAKLYFVELTEARVKQIAGVDLSYKAVPGHSTPN